jgi:hypothetical protein
MYDIKQAMLNCMDANLKSLATELNETQLKKLLGFFLEEFSTRELRLIYKNTQTGYDKKTLWEISGELYRQDLIDDILG